MIIERDPQRLYHTIGHLRANGKTVGFVPTMGYLHEGHLSLIRKARQDNNVVVASIFINPLQFGPNEDYAAYPRNNERDLELLKCAQVDYLFFPDVELMYPAGSCIRVHVAMGHQVLCGRTRPGHFDGVTTVVAKLFNIVRPHQAYFGLKDYQQYRIIKQMVHDLNMDLIIVGCPIVRESDGLAMSSRNTYLTAPEREQATHIYQGLKQIASGLMGGVNIDELYEKYHQYISKMIPQSRIEYLEVLDALTLTEITDQSDATIIATAIFIGKTRLIDNLIVQRNDQ